MKTVLLILAVAPSSSMGLGYVGLSRGNITAASAIVALAFLMSLVVYPSLFHILGVAVVSYPSKEILKDLLLVLILPLSLGVLTREYLERRLKIEHKKIQPLLSLITLISLYILILVIFLTKGKLIIKHWGNFGLIAPIAIVYYLLTLVFALVLDQYLFKLSYEDHQSVVFTTVSKNVALTIGLLVTIFKNKGSLMAMYPAIFSLFQILFLMSYLNLSDRVQKWWNKG